MRSELFGDNFSEGVHLSLEFKLYVQAPHKFLDVNKYFQLCASSTPDSVERTKKGKKRKYDTWAQAKQRLFVQLWAENHEWLESRES